jgi:hypothetical protein
MSLIPEWLSMTRLAWLRTAGQQFFFVFNEYNFSRKVGTGDFRKY